MHGCANPSPPDILHLLKVEILRQVRESTAAMVAERSTKTGLGLIVNVLLMGGLDLHRIGVVVLLRLGLLLSLGVGLDASRLALLGRSFDLAVLVIVVGGSLCSGALARSLGARSLRFLGGSAQQVGVAELLLQDAPGIAGAADVTHAHGSGELVVIHLFHSYVSIAAEKEGVLMRIGK